MEIIRYKRHDDMDVEFLDDFHFVKEHATYSNFKRGEIKNPYDKILFGVGYLGFGKWKSRYDKKISDVYLSWMHMLERCYDPDQHLDKDIKYPNNTIYSPYSCILVPQRINELFTCKPKENGLPVGISLSTSGKYVASYNGKHLGTYSELKDAYKIYAIAKEMAIQNVANDYKEIIPHEIYEILMKYKVLIENDKNYLSS